MGSTADPFSSKIFGSVWRKKQSIRKSITVPLHPKLTCVRTVCLGDFYKQLIDIDMRSLRNIPSKWHKRSTKPKI